MKRFMTLFLLTLPVFIDAQTLSVAEFRMNEQDVTVQNEACAVIKVQTTQKGFFFDGGKVGVTKVDDNHPSEIWVYVPVNLRTISIMHNNLGTIRDYKFPTQLQAGHIYTMKLISDKEISEQNIESTESPEDIYLKGKKHYDSKDYYAAVVLFKKSAELGNTDAQFSLGNCYYNGYGVNQDYNIAVEWYQKAANQGNIKAQYNLGVCYFNGKGLEKDYYKAVECYRKAADQGYSRAQNSLGNCYYNGYGVEKDYEKAREWYQKAADQGDKNAINSLEEKFSRRMTTGGMDAPMPINLPDLRKVSK